MTWSRLLLPAALAISSLGNFLVVWLVARGVPADQFVLFSFWLSVGQATTVVAFEWLRTAFIRFAGESPQRRASVQSLYLAVAVALALVFGIALAVSRDILFAQVFVLVVGQAAFDLSQAANRVTLSDRSFAGWAAVRSALSVVLVFAASAIDHTFGLQLLAFGSALGVPALVSILFWKRMDKALAFPVSRADAWFFLRFGSSIAFANLSFFITQAAIRGLAVAFEAGPTLPGRLLALEFGQRVFMNLGLAANLVFLQDGIRRVQQHGRGELPSLMRRQLATLAVLLLPVWAVFTLGGKLLAPWLAPTAMQAQFAASIPWLATACALFSLRTYAVDVAFVLEADGRRAYAGGFAGLLSTVGLFFAVLTMQSPWAFEGALVGGAVVSCLVSAGLVNRRLKSALASAQP